MAHSTDTPLPATSSPAPSGIERDEKQLSVSEAKLRFAEAMHALDVLEPLRKHPYVVLGSAVTAGAVLGSSGKVVLSLSALVNSAARLIKPLGGIVAQLAAAKIAAHTAANEVQEDAAPAPDATVSSV